MAPGSNLNNDVLARLKAAKDRGVSKGTAGAAPVSSMPAASANTPSSPPAPTTTNKRRESKRNALAMLKATNLKAMKSLSGGSKAMTDALRSAAGGVAGGSKKLSLSLAEGAKRMSNTSNSLAAKMALLKARSQRQRNVSASAADAAGGPEFDPEAFQPSLDWEVLGVRTREITLSAEPLPSDGSGDDCNRFGITVGEGRREADVGVHIVAIDNTGPAAAVGRVYVGDVILEVNGLLALYSEPGEVDDMLRFATGDVRIKLCAAGDLRACLHAEDSVDSHGEALAHDDDESGGSVAASIMACLAQMQGGEGEDNTNEVVAEGDTDDDTPQQPAVAPRRESVRCDEQPPLDETHAPAGTWDEFLAQAATAESRDDLFTASDSESDDEDHNGNGDDTINAPGGGEASHDGPTTANADRATAVASPVYDDGLMDLLMTPKAVVDELQAKNEALARMQRELEALKGNMQADAEAGEALNAKDRERRKTARADWEAEQARRAVAQRRLEDVRREIAQLPDARTLSRLDAVERAVKESELAEEARRIEMVLSQPRACPTPSPLPPSPSLHLSLDSTDSGVVDAAAEPTTTSGEPAVDGPAAPTSGGSVVPCEDDTPTSSVSDAAVAPTTTPTHGSTTTPTNSSPPQDDANNNDNDDNSTQVASSVTPSGCGGASADEDDQNDADVKPEPDAALSGSRVHRDKMGVYHYKGATHDGCPVFQREALFSSGGGDNTLYLYHSDKCWRVSECVGEKKCFLRRASKGATRPEESMEKWFETTTRSGGGKLIVNDNIRVAARNVPSQRLSSAATSLAVAAVPNSPPSVKHAQRLAAQRVKDRAATIPVSTTAQAAAGSSKAATASARRVSKSPLASPAASQSNSAHRHESAADAKGTLATTTSASSKGKTTLAEKTPAGASAAVTATGAPHTKPRSAQEGALASAVSTEPPTGSTVVEEAPGAEHVTDPSSTATDTGNTDLPTTPSSLSKKSEEEAVSVGSAATVDTRYTAEESEITTGSTDNHDTNVNDIAPTTQEDDTPSNETVEQPITDRPGQEYIITTSGDGGAPRDDQLVGDGEGKGNQSPQTGGAAVIDSAVIGKSKAGHDATAAPWRVAADARVDGEADESPSPSRTDVAEEVIGKSISGHDATAAPWRVAADARVDGEADESPSPSRTDVADEAVTTVAATAVPPPAQEWVQMNAFLNNRIRTSSAAISITRSGDTLSNKSPTSVTGDDGVVSDGSFHRDSNSAGAAVATLPSQTAARVASPKKQQCCATPGGSVTEMSSHAESTSISATATMTPQASEQQQHCQPQPKPQSPSQQQTQQQQQQQHGRGSSSLVTRVVRVERADHEKGFGFCLSKLDDLGGAVAVEGLQPGGAAERAGIVVGDILVGIEGVVVDTSSTVRDVAETLRAVCAGRTPVWIELSCCSEDEFRRSIRASGEATMTPVEIATQEQLSLTIQVHKKLTETLNTAYTLGFGKEEIDVLRSEVSRLTAEISELTARPRAKALTILRTTAPDGNEPGFRFEKDDVIDALVVTFVEDDSPAKHAGLCKGDVLLEIDGIDVYKKDANFAFDLLRASTSMTRLGVAPSTALDWRREESRRKERQQIDPRTVVAKSVSNAIDQMKADAETTIDSLKATWRQLTREVPASPALQRKAREAPASAYGHSIKESHLGVDGGANSASGGGGGGGATTITAEMIAASVKRVTLKAKTVGKDFGLRLSMHQGGQRILEVISVPEGSPFSGVPTECPVAPGDVLLAVGKYTLCQEYANVDAAQDLLECATVPCIVVFVPKTLVNSLPTDPHKLEWIARKSVDSPPSLRRHVQKWRAEQMVKEIHPPEVSAINVPKLELGSDKGDAAAGSHFIGNKTCLVCSERPKNTILGCGHGFCASCSERMHMCPVKNCQRIILSRTPMEHRFRSAIEERAKMGNGMPASTRAYKNPAPVDFPAASSTTLMQMSSLGSFADDDDDHTAVVVQGEPTTDDDSCVRGHGKRLTTPSHTQSAQKHNGARVVDEAVCQVAKTLDFESMEGLDVSQSKTKKKKRGGKKRHRVVDVIEVAPVLGSAITSQASTTTLAGTDV